MIVVWGDSSDPPAARVLDALLERAEPLLFIDAERLDDVDLDVQFGARPRGHLVFDGHRVDVDTITGLYLRPLDAATGRSLLAAEALLSLAETMDGWVVNRPSPCRANQSKPYQQQLIVEAGFDVPATLVTTDPARARSFLARHGDIVYKSVSGVRSIVARLNRDDAHRFDDDTFGPVHLQEYVDGTDVRVHVVDDRCYACAVTCDAVDYRYAAREGQTVTIDAIELPDDVAIRAVAMAAEMQLLLAGIDLRRTPDGRWVCFEVNPSPAFTWYEDETGHPIARATADVLSRPRRANPASPVVCAAVAGEKRR